MAFFNVDDHAHGHPKHRAAGLAAVGLWTLAGSYCRAYKLDGQVPGWYVSSWPSGGRLAATLTDVGLWHQVGHNCPDCPQPDDPNGWVFHDWLDIHDSSNEVERQRQQGRRRQRERRQKVRESLGAEL
jgi:hypothetical protein